MNIEKREQPELDLLLGVTTDQLHRLDYSGSLWYEYSCGNVIVGDKIDLTKPAYVLKLYFGDMCILQVFYELDTRFGLEVNYKEIQRVETVLADRCMAVMAANGAVFLYDFVVKNQLIPGSYIKESEDKGRFMNLN
jgi:hypothetical protein